MTIPRWLKVTIAVAAVAVAAIWLLPLFEDDPAADGEDPAADGEALVTFDIVGFESFRDGIGGAMSFISYVVVTPAGQVEQYGSTDTEPFTLSVGTGTHDIEVSFDIQGTGCLWEFYALEPFFIADLNPHTVTIAIELTGQSGPNCPLP